MPTDSTPLAESDERHGDALGSKWVVQLGMDRPELVLSESGSGKTETIWVLAYQLQAESDEAIKSVYTIRAQVHENGDNTYTDGP